MPWHSFHPVGRSYPGLPQLSLSAKTSDQRNHISILSTGLRWFLQVHFDRLWPHEPSQGALYADAVLAFLRKSRKRYKCPRGYQLPSTSLPHDGFSELAAPLKLIAVCLGARCPAVGCQTFNYGYFVCLWL